MQRRLRVLFCNFEYPPLGGGGGVVNALLAEELAKRHDVTVLTSQGLGAPREAAENGVRVIRVPVFFRRQQAAANLASMLAYLPMGTIKGRRLLRFESYDVVNTHFVLPTGPVGQALARYARIPNVLSVHGGDVYDPSKWSSPHRHALLRVWVRRLLRQAACVVGQSHNTLENVRRYYAPEIEGVRIPLGIKRPRIEPALRAHYGFSRDDVLLTTVGRLVPRKAIGQLISVMGKIDRRDVRLLILGTGPMERNLRDQARDLRVDDRVHFLGYVKDSEKFGVLQMSDVFVSTSQHEGFGLVFLEAMASGLPVICYDHGGQTDFLAHRQTGCVVPLNDLQQFFECCRELVGNESERKRMAQRNSKAVEELFIDRCASRYETLFVELVERQKERSDTAARRSRHIT